jgi:GNAT superfamily N-acetyltransferase
MRFELALLAPGDWAEFRDLRLRALADAPAAFSSKLADERRLGEAEWRARLAVRTQFVARVAGTAIGTVGAYCSDGGISLISMWVDPMFRCRGVGAALVDRVIAHARDLGYPRLRLLVTEGNIEAERLYTRCGFEPTGVSKPRPDADAVRREVELARML